MKVTIPIMIFALLILDPEDGGDTFLRNVGSHVTTQSYIPRIEIFIPTAVITSYPTKYERFGKALLWQ
jgi:hypothetical protein